MIEKSSKAFGKYNHAIPFRNIVTDTKIKYEALVHTQYEVYNSEMYTFSITPLKKIAEKSCKTLK